MATVIDVVLASDDLATAAVRLRELADRVETGDFADAAFRDEGGRVVGRFTLSFTIEPIARP